jgi:hypothetical protein
MFGRFDVRGEGLKRDDAEQKENECFHGWAR